RGVALLAAARVAPGVRLIVHGLVHGLILSAAPARIGVVPPILSEHSRGGTVVAAGFVVAGSIAVEVGAALAVTIFPVTGPTGIVTLRLVFAALILLVAFRPSLRGRSRADWLTVCAFGLVLAGMNVLFYLALERLPLGATVTIEYLGPLIL